jgi:uncharacterized membrane protein YbhN (UPF0104 family)
MQFTQIISKFFLLHPFTYRLLKGLVFLFLVLYAIYQFYSKDFLSPEFFYDIFYKTQVKPWVIALVLILLPFNWGLEALKWKLMVDRFTAISFFQAYQGVLTGIALGFATPHGLGDYFGRITMLNYHERNSLIGSVFLARIAQFSITLLAGGWFVVHFFYLFYLTSLVNLLVVSFGICLLLLVVGLVFKRLNIIYSIVQWPFIRSFFGKLTMYSKEEVGKVFLYSLFRYMVFSLQFWLLLLMFEMEGNWYLWIMGINLVFLAKSIIPTLFDLGVREYSAFYFFSVLGLNDILAVQASLLLWVVNVFFPAILGMFFIFSLKLRQKSDGYVE